LTWVHCTEYQSANWIIDTRNNRPHAPYHHPTPDKDAIALLPPFERLGLNRMSLVGTVSSAAQAFGKPVAALFEQRLIKPKAQAL
jgi:hypothetical protein